MNCKGLFTTVLLTIAMMLPWSSVMAAEDVRVPENRVIYEVFVRNFSPEGNFKGVEAQIPRLKQLGVDVVWLMPIYKLGDIGKWGTYSSPYAIKDYKAIDPDNGSAADLRSLISTIHANGMEIWFDWVGNHTSKDNVWVSSHPEYYGNNFYSPNGWSDVYQLDVNNAAMHEAMIDAMQYWVTEFDIDGYRCDYASGPSEEFWRKATSRVLKNGKRIAWLAEDDSKPELVSKGYFDYNYAWAFHDRLMDQTRGINLNNLRNECANLHNESAYKGRSRMVYLTNHDVVQDKGGTEDRIFGRYLKPMTVLQFTVYGMPLLYNGQEIQYKSEAVPLSEKKTIDWGNADTSMTQLITTLASLKHTEPALRTGSQNGSYTNLSTSNDNNIMAYRRSLGDSHVIVALNYSDNSQNFTFSTSLPAGTYKDVFTGKTINAANPGQITLPALGYAVFVKTDGQGGGDDPDPVIPAEKANIHIANFTGWDNVYLYAWADDRPDIFGTWGGMSPSSIKSINGTDYLVFTTDATGSYNIIFNNGTDKLADFEVNVENGKDYYFAAYSDGMKALDPGETPTPPDPDTPDPDDPDPVVPGHTSIYIANSTGWDNVYLYAWGDGEIFGTWPGATASSTRNINGTDYLVFTTESTGNYNLIFNNNSSQLADYALNIENGKEYYFSAESNGMKAVNPGDMPTPPDPDTPDPDDPDPVVTDNDYINLYVRNLTSWGTVKVYAWANGSPELYGGWPGASALGQRIIDGEEYLIFELPKSETTYNFIFSNNGSDNEKHEGLSFTPGNDTFVTLSGNGASLAEAPAATRHTIYVGNNTGWSNLYIYAWADGKPEFFGGWPGTKASATVTVNGASYLAFPFYDTENLYNLIFTDGSKQYDAMTAIPDHDIFVVAGPDKVESGATADIASDDIAAGNTAPVYYNLQGMRVDNPANGIFIEVRGNTSRKVLL